MVEVVRKKTCSFFFFLFFSRLLVYRFPWPNVYLARNPSQHESYCLACNKQARPNVQEPLRIHLNTDPSDWKTCRKCFSPPPPFCTVHEATEKRWIFPINTDRAVFYPFFSTRVVIQQHKRILSTEHRPERLGKKNIQKTDEKNSHAFLFNFPP